MKGITSIYEYFGGKYGYKQVFIEGIISSHSNFQLLRKRGLGANSRTLKQAAWKPNFLMWVHITRFENSWAVVHVCYET